MMGLLREYRRLPSGARNLILYYVLAMGDAAPTIFLTLYMFSLGFDVLIVGALYAYLGALSAVFGLLVGRVMDIRVPPKHFVIICEFIGVAEWIALILASRPEHFALAFLISAAAQPFYVSFRALERDLYPEGMLDIVYKHHMFWPYFVQFIIIPVCGYFLNEDFILTYRVILVIAASLCAIRALFVWKKIPETRPVEAEDEERGLLLKTIRNKKLFLVFSAELVVMSAYCVAPFFVIENYLFNIVRAPVFSISLLYALGGLIAAFGALFFGEFSPKKRALIVISLLSLSGASLLVYSLEWVEEKIVLALVAFVIFYFSDSVWWTAHETVVMSIVPKEHRGTVFGGISMLRRFMAPAWTVVAVLLLAIHPLVPYVVQAAMFSLAAVLYIPVLSKRSEQAGSNCG